MSEKKEEPAASDVQPDGDPHVVAKPPSPVLYRSVGRACEILAVASVTMFFFVYGLGLERLVALAVIVLLIVIAIVTYKLAIKYAITAEMAEKTLVQQQKARTAGLRYQVTDVRLRILEEAGVPGDVRRALAKLIKEEPPLPEQKFLAKIALDPVTDLGWERTLEFSEKILKYTKLDRKVDAISANSEGTPMAPPRPSPPASAQTRSATP